MKPISRLPLILSLVLSLTSGFRVLGEDITQDWGFIGEGQAISGSPYGSKGTPMLLQSKSAMVVDASTTPANPFANSQQSLYIDQQPESAVSRIRIRPFPDELPANGSYEINFRVAEGRFRLDTGVVNVPWDPANDWAYINTDVLFGIHFTADEAIQCKSVIGLRTPSVAALSAGENYTFRVEWATDGDLVVFQFQLNGEPLTTREGSPFTQSVPKSKIGTESLVISINVGSKEEPPAKVFVGNMSATAGSP
jgi:hypothetical protein